MIREDIFAEYFYFWGIKSMGGNGMPDIKEGGGKADMPSESTYYQSNLNIVEMDSSYSIYSLNEFTKS